jgi:hypothetical protein
VPVYCRHCDTRQAHPLKLILLADSEKQLPDAEFLVLL